ncbi:MAG: (2Fe-2S)-binding protein [Terricaulis sp.]
MTCRSGRGKLCFLAADSQSPEMSLLTEKCGMYVCNCNGVTRAEVDEAISAGAEGPEAVLAHHGCEPCCGRCLPEIADGISSGGMACGKRSLVAAE